MNERIKELARLSGMRTVEYEDDEDTHFTESIDIEKFAELIVRKCASLCNDVGTAVWAEQYQSNLGTAQTCKAVIEQHFGAE